MILLPFFVFGQEQVSDVQYSGTYAASNVSKNIGFAFIDGTNYMLQENDSLIIYRFHEDNFEIMHQVGDFDCQSLNNYQVDPNRSLFEIRDRKYFRFLENGLQIIDIPTGNVDFEYSGFSDEIVLLNPLEITDSHFYFLGLQNEITKWFKLNFATNELNFLKLEERIYHKQRGHLSLSLEDNNKIYIRNNLTGKDSLILDSSTGIYNVNFSPKDSMFVVLDNEGAVWRIDSELNLSNANCFIPNMAGLRSVGLNKDKLIAIYNHINGDIIKYRVCVYDLASCVEELVFITDEIESYAGNVQFVVNETDDTEYSLFGFYGLNPTDGLNRSLYYLIDHENNHYESLTDFSSVVSNTPFVHDSVLYFVGINSSFWGSNELFIRYSFEEQEFLKLQAETSDSRFVTYGFPENNAIFSSSNTASVENPMVWKLENDSFLPIQNLDFLYNLGLNYIDNILPEEDRIYFTTRGGLYSVLGSDRLDIQLPSSPGIINAYGEEVLSRYKNKFCLAYEGVGKTIFRILDKESGMVSTVIDSLVEASPNANTIAGPFIFYSDGNYGDTLLIMDSKTESILKFPDIPFIIPSWLQAGERSALFIYNTSNLIGPIPSYLIDYETNEIEELNIPFKSQVKLEAGADNSFYLFDYENGEDSIRIRILKDNGELSTIYDGPGDYYNYYLWDRDVFYFDPKSGTAHFCLIAPDGISYIVANDVENTEILEIEHSYGNSRGPFFREFEEKILLRTANNGFKYSIYQAFEPMIEVNITFEHSLRFSDFSNNDLVFIERESDGRHNVLRYDFVNDVLSSNEIENVCQYFHLSNGIRINEEEFIFSVRCDTGYEPWILDLRTNRFTQIEDINPGFASSLPRNFLLFKDWVYFTATIKDKSIQWFRYSKDLSSSTLELVDVEEKLLVYPSPTIDEVQLDKDLESLFIYSADGKMMFGQKDYRKNTRLQIGHLLDGNYLIFAQDKNHQHYHGKFVKISH